MIRHLFLISTLLVFFDSFAQIRITEIMAVNTWGMTDPDFGNYADWLEIQNTGTTTIDISNYSVSDKASPKTPWRFPQGTTLTPNTALILWADNENALPGTSVIVDWKTTPHPISSYHVNFKIAQSGETIYLRDADGILKDSVFIVPQQSDVSYILDLIINKWSYTSLPTPGALGIITSASSRKKSDEVAISPKGGLFTAPLSVTITAKADALIRYTLDGSIPCDTSPIYTKPITITQKTIVRARAFETGLQAGPFNTETYLVNYTTSLPRLYLTASSNDLWSNTHGLFSKSRKDLEIPVSLEYIDVHGKQLFNTAAGLSLFGSTIFQIDQKPMNIKFDGKYGFDVLEYPLFAERSKTLRYTKFVLRNGGNDNSSAIVRDIFFASLGAQIRHIDYQAYQPVVVYMNNDYMGIYSMREKIDEQYLADRYHISPNKLDIIEDSLDVKSGTSQNFLELLSQVKSMDCNDSIAYNEICQGIDIDGFINYFIYKSYLGYVSYMVNNKYWKEQTPEGKWRWISFDLEHGFACCGGQAVNANTISYLLTSSENEYSVQIFRKLMDNVTFSNRFHQRFYTLIQTTLSSQNTITLLDSMVNDIKAEMPNHIQKWGTPSSMSNWLYQIDMMKLYAQQRPGYLSGFIKTLAKSDTQYTYTFNIIGHGGIDLNDVRIDTAQKNSVLNSGTIDILAVPAPGYQFSHWSNGSKQTNISFVPSKDDTLTAYFIKADSIHYLAGHIQDTLLLDDTSSPYRIYSDLTIDTTAVLIVNPGVQILLDTDVNLIIKGRCYFNGTLHDSIRVTTSDENNEWGIILLDHAKDTVKISYTTFDNSGTGRLPLQQYATITSKESTIQLMHCSFSQTMQCVFTEGGSTRIDSCLFSTDRTGDLINLTQSSYAVTTNSEFRGNTEPDTDGIDYDNINNGLIKGNMIYGFRGSNSDAIDLGEESSNIIIQDNQIYYSTDKGISVGQGTTTHISNNLITLCNLGIAVKDEHSTAYVKHNTLDANNYALASYEKNPGMGGGIIYADSNAITNSDLAPFMVDSFSQIVSNHNRDSAIKYLNRSIFNFAVNGDDSLWCANLLYYPHLHPAVIINEINYNDVDSADGSGEWIELMNKSGHSINLNHWEISDGTSSYFFTNTSMANNTFNVTVRSQPAFEQVYPNVAFNTEALPFKLNRNGERINLFNEKGMIVNSVKYNDKTPWPVNAVSSIYFVKDSSDNTCGEQWLAYIDKGTPGKPNDYLNTIQDANKKLGNRMYPNPTTGQLFFTQECQDIDVYNSLGIKVKSVGKLSNSIDLTGLPDGLYLIILNGQSFDKVIKISK